MFADIFRLIIDTLSTLGLLIILMRFVLQVARADFYNPISQFVVKATNPILVPLRRVVPGFGGIDVASLLLGLLFQFLVLLLANLVLVQSIPNPLVLIYISALMVLGMLLKIYFWSLLIVIISSWIAPGSSHPALVLLNQLIVPLMRPFQKLLPPVGGFDLSPILVLLVLQVCELMLNHLGTPYGVGFGLM
jgi:YggT family protein